MNYKIVVPELVSLEADFDKLSGFYLSKNLNYFGSSEERLRFHFKSLVSDEINVSADYDFKNSRYQVKDDVWTYKFSKFGFDYVLQYDYLAKEFSFNNFAKRFFVRLNWIHPAGDHLADLINLELFTNGVVILNGISFKYNELIYIFCTPSQNGKTSFLNKNKERFRKIISDDFIIIDLNNMKMVSTPLLEGEKDISYIKWHPIEKINMIVNSVNGDKQLHFTKKEFVKMSAMKFQDNIFVKNLIFYYHLEKVIDNMLDKIDSSDVFEINNVKNYDYEQLIRG
jgi:hypothetical protein